MQLFALVHNTSPRVHRIELAQKVQVPLEQVFQQQGAALLNDVARIPFDGRYAPYSDEILLIKDFHDQDDLLGAGTSPLQCPILKIDDAVLQNLLGLFVVTKVNGTRSVCLQIFDRRRALTKEKFALFNSIGEGLQRLEHTGLILDIRLTAVLQGTNLLFKSFHSVSRLFDLSTYYHEATDEELETFSAHDSIAQTPAVANFLTLADTTRIRKQVALILDSKILDKVDSRTIVKQAKLFGLKIATMDHKGKKKIVLPENRSDLREVLDFLQENVYKGCLTDTTFVSNSKRVKIL
jgi:hypothetical protein